MITTIYIKEPYELKRENELKITMTHCKTLNFCLQVCFGSKTVSAGSSVWEMTDSAL